MDISLYNKRRASYGGLTQVNKLNYTNKKLFDRACKEAFDSYIMVINEKEDIDEDTKNESKTKAEENITPLRGLMLEDKLTLEVDQKWFVLPLETKLKPGDVVKVSKENWEDSYWIMVQEDLAERTFKRCVGKKCVTKVSWRDEDDVVYTSWAALRGPTETSIKSESRGNFLFDRGNEKLALWLPDTEYTLGLRRYKYLMVENEVWKIASVDYFTTPGILELALVEAQDNVWTDNKEDKIAFIGNEIAITTLFSFSSTSLFLAYSVIVRLLNTSVRESTVSSPASSSETKELLLPSLTALPTIILSPFDLVNSAPTRTLVSSASSTVNRELVSFTEKL